MSQNTRDRWVALRQKYVDLFDGDLYGPLLLEAMLRWQKYADDHDREGDWFYRSARSIATDDLFEAVGKSTVYDRLTELQDLGYLDRREPEDDQSAPWWRVDVVAVNQDLCGGQSVDGYAVRDVDNPVRETDEPVRETDRGVRQTDTGGGSKARTRSHESTHDSQQESHSDGGGSTSGDRTPAHEDPPPASPPNAASADDSSEHLPGAGGKGGGSGDGGADHHHHQDTPEVVEEAARSTMGDRIDQLADKYEIGENRATLPPSERMDVERLSAQLQNRFGLHNTTTPAWVERMELICARFREDEIDDAIETVEVSADSPGWGYLRSVLASYDDSPNDDEKFREPGGVPDHLDATK